MLRATLRFAVLSIPFAFAWPLALEKDQPTRDQTTVVPDASMIAQTYREISACKVTLGEAAAAVVRATGGAVDRAVFTIEAGQPAWDISAWSADKTWRCTVDGTTGLVTQRELPSYTFPGDSVTSTWTTAESGLRFTDLKVGTGPAPKSERSVVKVHYSGWLLDGTAVESTLPRNEPATYPLNGVMSGWTEGIASMRVGGKRKLVIPSTLAYGDRGSPASKIPSKATLVFDIELLQIVSE